MKLQLKAKKVDQESGVDSTLVYLVVRGMTSEDSHMKLCEWSEKELDELAEEQILITDSAD